MYLAQSGYQILPLWLIATLLYRPDKASSYVLGSITFCKCLAALTKPLVFNSL